jgi:TPR repeat protein/tRNA A-37 threonylcarbamoyl transferase component Bud32
MIGQVVGSYRIAGVIGEGGMGVVYLGQHAMLDRRAAIKVLLPEYSRDQDMVRRFFNEARAANAIRHPGIVEIHDFGFAADGRAFIIMELLEGESLQQRIDNRHRGWLPPASAVLIARQIAGALGAAHRVGIVHRDLKPDNVYLIRDPEVPGGERIKLLDFGIAKLGANPGDRPQVSPHERTRTGVIMGTPTYMAPEQCRGAGEVDHRADLYALGCIIYRMLCGRAPFAGMGQGETLAAHLHLPVERPRTLVSGLPADLEALVLRLLEKNPALRHQSTDELIADLDRLSVAGPASQPPRFASESGHVVSTLSHAAAAHAGASPGSMTMPGRRRAMVLGVVAAFAAVGAGVAALVMIDRGPGGRVHADAGVAAVASDAATVAQNPPVDAGVGVAWAAWAAVTEAQCQPALAHAAGVMAGAEIDSASAPYRYYARYLDTPDEARRMLTDCAESYDAEALACLAAVGAPGDVVRCGNALAERQCRHGDQVGCVSVAARLYADGRHEQAARHAQDACQSGVSAGCTLLGTMHFYGRGATLDLDAARRLFERGHALGDPDAGSALADMLYHGIGGRPDPAAARSLYQQVCDELPTHGACVGLGELEERGTGGRASRRAAIERYQAACDRDGARGCALLAGRVSEDQAETLYTRARALYELGAAHSPRSAFHLAELTRDGKGGPRDPAGAASLLARACAENEPLACEASGDLYVSGKISIDLGRSRQAYEQACAAGIERACLGVECHKLLAQSDQSGAWAERIAVCRDGGLLPRTRRPVTPPRRAPDSARSGAPMDMVIE